MYRAQVAAQQHQVTLTEHYDTVLARDLSPPSESAADLAVNQSLHRLSQVLQATLLSIAGHDPSEISERADTGVEASGPSQPPGTRPPSEPRERRPSDAPPLQSQSELADHADPPQPDTTASPSAQVEFESQAQLSPSEPPLSHDSSADPAIATATATVDVATTPATTVTTAPVKPSESPEPSPTTHPDTENAELDSDWSEVREHEITRLESENAQLRALLGIDPNGLAAAGIPDIDTEPPFLTPSFYGASHPPAAGSSAWANTSAETANPFTQGFREDPSVLGLAATPSRLHTLTPPNAPHAIMTDASTDGTTSSTSGALPSFGSGLFVSASWAAPPAGGGNGPGPIIGLGGQGPGQGPGMGPGPGPMGAPQMQQQKSSPPPLGFPGLARSLELQGPGVGPGSGPGGPGRGRGVLFGGRGRSVGW